MFTISQLARTAGVSRRTLHYYDEIDLLKPTRVGANGYRYYGEAELLRLQQILLYRELDLPLDQIREILGQVDFDLSRALEAHREQLTRRIERLERLIRTVDDTLVHMKGLKEMTPEQLFEPFNEEQQAAYQQEAMQTYDPEIVKASNKKWKSYSNEQKQRIGEEGNAVYQGFLDARPKGAESPEAQACVAAWRKHLEYFWSPDAGQMLGLADLYNDDPRFKANFDRIDPDLAEFVRQAVQVYVARLG
jgi:DNA-binding transcriptional MerR regulator